MRITKISDFKNSIKNQDRNKLSVYITKIFTKFDRILINNKKSVAFLIIVSLIFNLLLEASLRLSVFSALYLIVSSPVVFLLGTSIVFATFSLTYFSRRRSFAFSVIAFLWLVITLVNFCLMCLFKRSTPFNFSDLRIFNTTRDIINNGYVGIFELILILVAMILFVALLLLIFFKSRKKSSIANVLAFFPIQVCSLTLIFVILYTNIAVRADRFDNLPNKYREHGFAFCFLYSLIDTGIEKPDDYSPELYDDTRKQVNQAFKPTENSDLNISLVENEELIDNIYSKVISEYRTMPNYSYLDFDLARSQSTISYLQNKYGEHSALIGSNPENSVQDLSEKFERPNIIFLQLESFYDVNNIEGYEYSSDPHPIYSMLKKELPGGKLTVPSIGAGTANTEFEVLTGMDVSFFGIAEYPYLSVLQNQTCESMCYNAKDYGYTTHAIHNHKGNFYDRYRVFPNLGFDTFSSIESFAKIERNQRSWCKDSMLLEPILTALKSTEGHDLVYTISVQPHGNYPSESVYNEMLNGQLPKISVTGNEHNPENPGFTYYVNQLNEVDTFIGRLILELSFINEPTVLVFYGDHIPAFSVEKYWNLKEGNCYQTDYIVWNNCGIDFSDAKDLTTFQLSSYIFSKLGIDSGEVNKLNRIYLDNDDVDDYHSIRHKYQFAIFYDDTLKDPTSKISIPTYPKANTKYGVFHASISNVYTFDNKTYITGNGFNEFTKILVNGSSVETEVIDSGTISTSYEFKIGDIISTGQLSGSAILGTSSNVVNYSQSMVVPHNLYDETLDQILPSSVAVKQSYSEN